MSFEVPEVQKKVVTEEKIAIITQREESPPPAGTPPHPHNQGFSSSFFNCMSFSVGLPVLCSFSYTFLKIYINVILQVPEIPKKKVPEEKRPVPRKEEVPPPKGIASCLTKAIFYNVMLRGKDDLGALWCVKSVWGQALSWASVGEHQSSNI